MNQCLGYHLLSLSRALIFALLLAAVNIPVTACADSFSSRKRYPLTKPGKEIGVLAT